MIDIPKHDSMRGEFAYALYQAMAQNPSIYLVTADLGYKMFDYIRRDFPARFINTGAAEQTALDFSVGLSYRGRIAFVYSITPFLIYRGFETIRTYIAHEQLPVKLIGSGRDDDYKHDGFSHDASDIPLYLDYKRGVLDIYPYYPDDKAEIPAIVTEMIENPYPQFLSLKR